MWPDAPVSNDVAILTEQTEEETTATEITSINETIETSSLDDTVVLKTLFDEEVSTTALDAAGTRDNTPVCYVPTTSGVTVYSNALAEIDASNTTEGYITVNYKSTNQKAKLQKTGSNGVTYVYTLNSGYETFPLSNGPYLYPNQNVNFNAESQVVAKAKQLAEGCSTDLDVVTKVYNYAATITILGAIEPTLVIAFSLIVGLILLSVIIPLIGVMSSIG